MNNVENKIEILIEEATRFAKEMSLKSPRDQIDMMHKNATYRSRNLNSDNMDLDSLDDKAEFQILSKLHRKEKDTVVDKPKILEDMKKTDRRIQQNQLKNFEKRHTLDTPNSNLSIQSGIPLEIDAPVKISNGGGYFGTQATLKGNNSLFQGTPLVDGTADKGMQFYHDFGKKNNSDGANFYATRNAIHSGDIPSRFTGDILSSKIQHTPKKHEIGIKTQDLNNIDNPKIRHLNPSIQNLKTYTNKLPETFRKYSKK